MSLFGTSWFIKRIAAFFACTTFLHFAWRNTMFKLVKDTWGAADVLPSEFLESSTGTAGSEGDLIETSEVAAWTSAMTVSPAFCSSEFVMRSDLNAAIPWAAWATTLDAWASVSWIVLPTTGPSPAASPCKIGSKSNDLTLIVGNPDLTFFFK